MCKLFYGNAIACRGIKYNLMKYVLSFLKQHTMPIPSINNHGCSTGPSNLNSGQQNPSPDHCPSPWLRQTTHKTLYSVHPHNTSTNRVLNFGICGCIH